MSMFTTEEIDGILVIRLTCTMLTEETDARELGSHLIDQADKHAGGRILIDCTSVNFMGSSTIGQFFQLLNRCKADGTALALCNVAETIRKVFKIVRLSNFIPICEDQAAGIAELKAVRTTDADADLDAEKFRAGAEAGQAHDQYNLGRCYEVGQGVKQDFAAAYSWYAKASDGGDANAQFTLGRAYAYGIHHQVDFDAAIHWFREAAAQGHQEAQYVMAMSHTYGLGVEQDEADAVT